MPTENSRKAKVAERITAVRVKLGMSQAQFSKALKTGQGSVSKWEKATNRPTPDMLARIAVLAPDADKFFFLEEAGIPKEFFFGTMHETMTQEMISAAGSVVSQAFEIKKSVPPQEIAATLVPLLRDPIAAGNPRSIDEADVGGYVPMLAAWLPKGAIPYAFRIVGDSMWPVLAEDYIAIVDVTKRDPKNLIEHLVLARVGEGCTAKWLRHNNKHYTLVPQNASPRHEVRVMNDDDDWAILGEVIRWIGAPPSPRKG